MSTCGSCARRCTQFCSKASGIVIWHCKTSSELPFWDVLYAVRAPPRYTFSKITSRIKILKRQPCSYVTYHSLLHLENHFSNLKKTNRLSTSWRLFCHVPLKRDQWDEIGEWDWMTLHMSCGGLGSRPKKMYGERLGDGVEYHLMKPTPRR